jgi:predicted ferric reductase
VRREGEATIERDLDEAIAAGDEPLDAAGIDARLALRDRTLAQRVLRATGGRDARRMRPSALRSALDALDRGPPEGRLAWVFDLFDADGSGGISREEFVAMLEGTLARANLSLARGALLVMADAVFASAGPGGKTTLSREAFLGFIASEPALSRVFSGSIVAWLGARSSGRARGAAREASWTDRVRAWAHERGAGGIAAGALLALTTVGSFAWGALRYRASGASGWVQLARGMGRVLDVLVVVLLALVMRRALTALRRTSLGARLPVDDALGAHRLVAWIMLVAAAVHTVAHGVNYANTGRLARAWTESPSAASGAVLLAIFLGMAWFARASVRRSGHFERFVRAHRLAYVFVPLYLVHAPGAIPWALCAAALWVFERAWRRRGVRRTRALWIEPLPAGVTRLEIETPAGWEHRPGDYLFLRIPSIARDEWHPFTISSAPENRGALTVHVRSVGTWTRALHTRALDRAAGIAPARLDLEVDGPFGAPASELFSAKVPVLIGAGIGVTPFAAVLESLRHRARRGVTVPDRVYFIWVVREQQAFGWFAERLCGIEAEDSAGRFDLRVFVTSADLRGGSGPWISAALDALHARFGRDTLTGLRHKTGLSAPDWDALLAPIAAAHGADAEAFFCGPEGLADTVRAVCAGRGIPFHQERF